MGIHNAIKINVLEEKADEQPLYCENEEKEPKDDEEQFLCNGMLQFASSNRYPTEMTV